MKRTILQATAIAVLLLLGAGLYSAPKITLKVQGKWQIVLRPSDLMGGAGSDFMGGMESAANEISLTISKTLGPTAPWRLDLVRVDTNWNPAFNLYAVMTSPGTGDGTVNGGTVYQEITTTDQEFLNGTGDRSKMEVQLKITGVSVQNLLVDTYITTLYYTVMEL